MKPWLFLVAPVLALPIASALGPLDAELTSPPAAQTVGAVNFLYNPPVIVAFVGEPVVWVAQEGCHTVNLDIGTTGVAFLDDDGGTECPAGNPANDPDDDDGVILQVAFTSTGAWEYFCSVPTHRERGMIGTVVVV